MARSPRRVASLGAVAIVAALAPSACSVVLGINDLPPVGEFVSTVDASAGLTCKEEQTRFDENPVGVCSAMAIAACKGLPIKLSSCVASPGALTVGCSCDTGEAGAGGDDAMASGGKGGSSGAGGSGGFRQHDAGRPDGPVTGAMDAGNDAGLCVIKGGGSLKGCDSGLGTAKPDSGGPT